MRKKKKRLIPIRCVKYIEINLYEINYTCTVSAMGK